MKFIMQIILLKKYLLTIHKSNITIRFKIVKAIY